MSHKLKTGTQVQCPRKRHVIGVLKEDVQNLALLSLAKINYESGQDRVAGEIGGCKLCGSLYLTQGKIYTEYGWLPHEPKLETPTRR